MAKPTRHSRARRDGGRVAPPPSLPLRGLRGARAPLRKRPAMHPGQTACDETHAAFGRRSIPAERRRCAPLIVAFQSEYTRASSPGGGSSLTRLVSRTPRPHRENWPTSALTWVPPPAVHRVASRRSSLRFGRNTPGPVLPVGAPPSRALSAGRLARLGAHVGSTTGCSPPRFAVLIVAFRWEYTRASSPGGGSSLARLVSRAPRPSRCSRGFPRRL